MSAAPAPLAPPPAIDWRRNLAVVWISQFVSIGAFSFTLPFVPMYLKDARIVPPDEVNSYAAWFQTCASIGLIVMSPVWGILGDRYGRKMMLVRANLGGAIALYLMGVFTNIHALLALRVFQGAFTGTTPAAQTLVTVCTPPKHQAFALGLMASAIALGDLVGKWFGAEVAATWGVPAAFKISGLLLLLSTGLVVVAAKERFVRARIDPATASVSTRMRARHPVRAMARLVGGLSPLFSTFVMLGFIITLDGVMLSLYFHDLGRHLPGVSELDPQEFTRWTYRTTGQMMAAAGIASALSALLTGWVLDRWRGRWFVLLAGVGMAAGMLGTAYGRDLPGWLGFVEPQAGHMVIPCLFGVRILVGLCFTALNSAQQVWTGRCSAPEYRGTVFGVAATARALGWISAPQVAALLANHYGRYPPIYVVAMGAMLLVLPLMLWMSIKYASPRETLARP